jgi:hypothetical protein
MAAGWKIVATTPNTGSGMPLQEWLIVAIDDKDKAVLAVKERYPHAEIRVDSRASAEDMSKYIVQDGEVFVLVEGS